MPDLVERFRREARAASKIGHPNIVDVTDSGTTADGSVYFVMEYLEGVELGSVIEREGALDVARALRIAGQICRALSAAHREGIIHRDLKPENIFLITRGGEADFVKVLDFGIAKTTEAEAARERRLTSPGMAMGTPEYMAPEQAAGRPADARCDVYALGAIMYEMVTGVPPYQGDNFMEILTKKATLDPPPPITMRPELPAQVCDLVLAAMSRNPDTRPQSMESLEYELNKCLVGPRRTRSRQILGMTTDANVVATLNPGLSTRNLDSGIVNLSRCIARCDRRLGNALGRVARQLQQRSGHGRPPPDALGSGARCRASRAWAARPSNQIPIPRGSKPNIVVPRAAHAGADRSVGIEHVVADRGELAPARTGQLKRSGMAVFGWFMLVLILLGGGAAVAYVMLFQKKDPEVVPAAALDQRRRRAEGLGGEGTTSRRRRSPTRRSPRKRRPSKRSSRKPRRRPSPRPRRRSKPAAARDTKTTTPKATKTVAIAEKATPAQISDTAKKAEASGDWDTALVAYQRLEKAKGYKFPGYAVYKQALMYFQLNDTANAQAFADKAAKMPGNQKNDAKMLYADVLFKQGDYQRAKDFYIALRKQMPREEGRAREEDRALQREAKEARARRDRELAPPSARSTVARAA